MWIGFPWGKCGVCFSGRGKGQGMEMEGKIIR